MESALREHGIDTIAEDFGQAGDFAVARRFGCGFGCVNLVGGAARGLGEFEDFGFSGHNKKTSLGIVRNR